MTVTTTTKLMYDAISEGAFDLNAPLSDSLVNVQNSLITGDMEGIRNAFKDGMTLMLLPEDCNAFGVRDREDIEVRVTCSNTGKLIGIIIDSELNY